MLPSLLLATALWPSSVTQNCKPLDNSIMIGVAQTSSGAHLYCELVSQPDASSLEVIYVLNDKKIAEKKISYGANNTTPEITQKDFRFGEIREARLVGQNIELHYQADTQKKIGTALTPLQKTSVIDAGFDDFIRNHWNELQTGKMLPVSFASIAHLKALPLRVSLQPIEKCGTKSTGESPGVCFIVEIDNAVLRILLGNIKLTYDQQHRLYEFNGVVNILGEDKENQKAIIHYFYSTDYSKAE